MKRLLFAVLIVLSFAGIAQGGNLATWDGITLPAGGGGSMVYPPAGTAISSGSAWATSVINNTGAGSDVALAIGQKAYITVSGATSIPLHIATSGATGEQYEITLSGTSAIVAQGNSSYLNANNTTQASAWTAAAVYGANSGTGGAAGTNNTSLISYASSPVHATIKAWTSTTAKMVASQEFERWSGINMSAVYGNQWNDTTTVWSSLGTIVLPTAWTGTVTIERKF